MSQNPLINAGASAAQQFTADSTNVGAPRSIIERMTNPTPADLQAGDGLKALGRTHVETVVEAFIKYLGQHRDDIIVNRFAENDGHGWVIKLMNTENPVTRTAPAPPPEGQ